MPSSHLYTALRRRRARTLLTLFLAATIHVAYAAEPPAPDRLAAQAAGVVGSGDQLSLRIRAPEGERIVKIGEIYADGWALQALSPTKATLAKDGATREVGLNPTGAVAPNTPAAPPSTVTMVGLPSEAMIQAYIDRNPALFASLMAAPDVKALTTEEARRYYAETMAARDEAARRQAAGGSPTIDVSLLRAVLGEAGADDYLANRTKGNTGMLTEQIADLRARPYAGPSSYYVPAGANAAQVAAAQGIDTRGAWTNSVRDAQGGVTRTRSSQTANEAADSLAQTLAANPSGIPGAELRPTR